MIMESLRWDSGLKYLKGVGDKIAAIFSKNDVSTFWELLFFLPRLYEDRRRLATFEEIVSAAGSAQVVLGRAFIEGYRSRPGPGGRRRMEASAYFMDDSSQMHRRRLHFAWFYAPPGLEKRFPPGSAVFFRGKPQEYRGLLQIVHPEFQPSESDLPEWEFGSFVPIYREIGGLSSKQIRKILYFALSRISQAGIEEVLPQTLRERNGLADFEESIRELHFPKAWEPSPGRLYPSDRYMLRLVFEELFMMSLALRIRRTALEEESRRLGDQIPQMGSSEEQIDRYTQGLPFVLTADQKRVLWEVLGDLACVHEVLPMQRLVQGDVGSGKTIVAFLSALIAMDAGYQVALMAPTEILASQHFENFCRLFPERSHECSLLKGALTAKSKKQTRGLLESGATRFVIGTQALLTDDTLFDRLGLVIVDEQHRFGVEQRLGLRRRQGELLTHLLVMTATPIPRSLALTLYGDLELSVIREKPKGRTPIETHLVRAKARDKLKIRLQRFLQEGRQIYIVYPLVEESEELDLTDVQSAHREWSEHFGAHRVGLLHGKLKSREKESVMARFKSGEIQVLVATTVIEVGIDVPNASVMVIEHAERFGLSQLHQLRGRVGRGSQQSFCVLVGADELSDTATERLQILVESGDGFEIAEKDLDLRGPGEFLGRRQSGLPGFRVAHILRDLHVLEAARLEAEAILKTDPRLEAPHHRGIKETLPRWWKGRLDLTQSG
jgi:ATP-dependent DNA helicase RecG